MSTQTLTPEARRHVALFSGDATFGTLTGVKMYKKQKEGKSVLVVENMPVFRSGTFRDSMGFQHTWDPIHISQMVSHWNLLRDRKILESVPVRKGHGSFLGDPMDGLVGWHTRVASETRTNPVDNKEYEYLITDFEVLDDDAQVKVEKGLWRNLSSEIMSYVTNDETEFWPVYGGVAYVDFSAVEGLREFSKNSKSFSLMFENEKEAPAVSGDQNNNGPAQTGTGEGQGTPTAPQTPPQPTTQPEQTPQQQTPETTAGTTQPEQTTGTTTESGTDEGDNTDHSRNGTQFCFMLNKTPSTPIPLKGLSAGALAAFQLAQTHIDKLETYRKGQIEGHRKEFVSGLASSGKILASDIDRMQKFALGLTDEQFADWSAVYTSAPSSSLFEKHGATPGDQNAPQQSDADKGKERMGVIEEIVADHKRSGFSKEKLESTSSWKELQQLKAKYNKS